MFFVSGNPWIAIYIFTLHTLEVVVDFFFFAILCFICCIVEVRSSILSHFMFITFTTAIQSLCIFPDRLVFHY